ncbi:unnamed protein product [Prorocentrum cordatum]|uniref:Uncharacterized protein n=1 Tax=Prorocentrum cordatum TaxID=2364126 RepID=A0ABN9RLH3_9DINO|nr:unnamed protein product [Polarella glacialis]
MAMGAAGGAEAAGGTWEMLRQRLPWGQPLRQPRYYEHVSHDIPMRESRATSYRLPLLRAQGYAYRLPRHARLAEAIGPVIGATGAITLVVHILPVQQARRFPLVRAQSLVDGQLLQALGTPALEARQLPGWLAADAELGQMLADQRLHERLHEAGLQDSRGGAGTAGIAPDLDLDASQLESEEAQAWQAIYQSMAQELRDDSFHGTIGKRLEKWLAEDGEVVPGDLQDQIEDDELQRAAVRIALKYHLYNITRHEIADCTYDYNVHTSALSAALQRV